MEKKLFLFENYINDDISEQGHTNLFSELQKLKRTGEIDFFVQVPFPKAYQFFIYLDGDAGSLPQILELFIDNRVFFRYRELM